MPLVALMPLWRDVGLALEAVASVLGSVDAVYCADGAFRDLYIEGIIEGTLSREDWQSPDAERLEEAGAILVPPMVYTSEGEKRGALLEHARLDYPEGWALWLDTDERLRNGRMLAPLLEDLPPQVLRFPLPFLDDVNLLGGECPRALDRAAASSGPEGTSRQRAVSGVVGPAGARGHQLGPVGPPRRLGASGSPEMGTSSSLGGEDFGSRGAREADDPQRRSTAPTVCPETRGQSLSPMSRRRARPCDAPVQRASGQARLQARAGCPY